MRRNEPSILTLSGTPWNNSAASNAGSGNLPLRAIKSMSSAMTPCSTGNRMSANGENVVPSTEP
eukprot:5795881-Prymnesium_polylepis.2